MSDIYRYAVALAHIYGDYSAECFQVCSAKNGTVQYICLKIFDNLIVLDISEREGCHHDAGR